MDLLINNIELPVSSREQVILYIQFDGTVHVEGEPFRNCRAIEMGPHGRCIDADELEKAAEKMAICDSYEYTIAHEMVKGLLKTAPTVLEASNDDDYSYEMQADMRDYCERYEPTYNPEDGSM